MTTEQLHEKYGETKIGVFNANLFKGMETWTPASKVKLSMFDDKKLEYLPRYAMETDTNYRQPIPYVLIRDLKGRYFTTRRKAGDDRLVGKISIGVGGHVEENETINLALSRECNEEIDFPYYVSKIKLVGCIVANDNDVDKVHFGLVYQIIADDLISVKEKDTLIGEWMTLAKLKEKKDELESWAKILLENNVLNKNLSCNEIASGLKRLYTRKNKDYGNSFHNTHKTFGIAAGFARINDKIERIASISSGKQQVSDESLLDTIGDAANYALMMGAELLVNKRTDLNNNSYDTVIKMFELLEEHVYSNLASTPYISAEMMLTELNSIFKLCATHDDFSKIHDNQKPTNLLIAFAIRMILTYREVSIGKSVLMKQSEKK